MHASETQDIVDVCLSYDLQLSGAQDAHAHLIQDDNSDAMGTCGSRISLQCVFACWRAECYSQSQIDLSPYSRKAADNPSSSEHQVSRHPCMNGYHFIAPVQFSELSNDCSM